jgi:hypothetical protein
MLWFPGRPIEDHVYRTNGTAFSIRDLNAK